MCGPLIASCTDPTSTPAISSASSIDFLIDSTAASRLTTTPRFRPFESVTPMPITSTPPSSSSSPTTVHTLAVPMSRPTTYRSCRATNPPCPLLLRLRRFRRPHVHPFVEPQIHVIDAVEPLVQRRREIDVLLQARHELGVAEVQQRRIAVENHDRVVKIRD